ncbi:MAG: CHAP domain-containing protein [Oscillospiraceae bacterium]|nr:CHAP domain-containing protein [Oscillospiraceae bacterium]
MKRNAGFTLVELIVGIAVASIVTAAATTLLLMGLRMNKASSDTATRQNTARIVLTVLEDLAAEKNIQLIDEDGARKVKKIEGASTSTLFSYKENAIYLGDPSETPIMTDVKATITAKSDKLLELKLEVIEETQVIEEYTSSVYCRLAALAPETGSSNDTKGSVSSLIAATKLESTLPARENFLNILTAEEGSTGISMTTGEYFSEWYIGSYEENPAWGPDTPWCACFLSWALDQCAGDIKGWVPRYANVDEFMKSFDRASWKTESPEPGDILFFDWQAPYDDPEHVGAVTEVRAGYVYTVEGNSNGKVETCCYSLEDPRILGYGVLNWK